MAEMNFGAGGGGAPGSQAQAGSTDWAALLAQQQQAHQQQLQQQQQQASQNQPGGPGMDSQQVRPSHTSGPKRASRSWPRRDGGGVEAVALVGCHLGIPASGSCTTSLAVSSRCSSVSTAAALVRDCPQQRRAQGARPAGCLDLVRPSTGRRRGLPRARARASAFGQAAESGRLEPPPFLLGTS